MFWDWPCKKELRKARSGEMGRLCQSCQRDAFCVKGNAWWLGRATEEGIANNISKNQWATSFYNQLINFFHIISFFSFFQKQLFSSCHYPHFALSRIQVWATSFYHYLDIFIFSFSFFFSCRHPTFPSAVSFKLTFKGGNTKLQQLNYWEKKFIKVSIIKWKITQ